MKKISLQATSRVAQVRKGKKLRAKTDLMGNVYGKGKKSQMFSIALEDFTRVLKEAGETQLVDLVLGTESIPVLLKNVQYHPVTLHPMHVDFYQVDLKEKIKAMAPIELIGEAEAVSQKLGALLSLLDEIEVEAYPQELPEKIEVHITKLAKVGDAIKVSDIVVPSTVVIVTPPDTEVVRIDELVSKEAEELVQEQTEASQAAAETQAATVKATADAATTNSSEKTGESPKTPEAK